MPPQLSDFNTAGLDVEFSAVIEIAEGYVAYHADFDIGSIIEGSISIGPTSDSIHYIYVTTTSPPRLEISRSGTTNWSTYFGSGGDGEGSSLYFQNEAGTRVEVNLADDDVSVSSNQITISDPSAYDLVEMLGGGEDFILVLAKESFLSGDIDVGTPATSGDLTITAPPGASLAGTVAAGTPDASANLRTSIYSGIVAAGTPAASGDLTITAPPGASLAGTASAGTPAASGDLTITAPPGASLAGEIRRGRTRTRADLSVHIYHGTASAGTPAASGDLTITAPPGASLAGTASAGTPAASANLHVHIYHGTVSAGTPAASGDLTTTAPPGASLAGTAATGALSLEANAHLRIRFSGTFAKNPSELQAGLTVENPPTLQVSGRVSGALLQLAGALHVENRYAPAAPRLSGELLSNRRVRLTWTMPNDGGATITDYDTRQRRTAAVLDAYNIEWRENDKERINQVVVVGGYKIGQVTTTSYSNNGHRTETPVYFDWRSQTNNIPIDEDAFLAEQYDRPEVDRNTRSDVNPNWEVQSVGVYPNDEAALGITYDVLWDSDNRVLHWHDAPDNLTQAFRLTGRYPVRIIVQRTDHDAVADMQRLVSYKIVDPAIISEEYAEALITAKLREHGSGVVGAAFDINTASIITGQLIMLEDDEYPANSGEYVVQRVIIKRRSIDEYISTVEVGIHRPNLTEQLTAVQQRALRSEGGRTDETLVDLTDAADGLTVQDAVVQFLRSASFGATLSTNAPSAKGQLSATTDYRYGKSFYGLSRYA